MTIDEMCSNAPKALLQLTDEIGGTVTGRNGQRRK
jgi:hypothetical protein